MMLSVFFASNTLEQWLFIIVVVLTLGSTITLLAFGAILEIRYISPFTLIKTSNKEKWRRATILALMLTAMLPIYGMAMLIIYTPNERLPMFLLCNGIWIIVLPLATLYKRWEFESHIKRYRYFDKMIKDKNSPYHTFLAFPYRMMRIFMTSEQKQFFNEGFPNDMNEKTNEGFSKQEQSEDFKS